MSIGLTKKRPLDDAPGVVGIAPAELPPLPDAIMSDPKAGWSDPRAWFARPELPLEIEIGCGKGSFILQEAAANPGVNYLALEYEREVYMYAADRVRRRGLTNVRVLYADAPDFLRWRCAPDVARVIHLYYSDPWPKRKHHKNRVVQDRFLAEAWRVLQPDGELRVVTDHDELWEWNVQHFDRWCAGDGPIPDALRIDFALPTRPFESLTFTPPTWAEEGSVVGTNYERKFTSVDKPPHARVLRKATWWSRAPTVSK